MNPLFLDLHKLDHRAAARKCADNLLHQPFPRSPPPGKSQHEHAFARRHAERTFDLFMARMADQDRRAALAGVTLDFGMDLGNERAGRIYYAKVTRPCMVPFARCDAVGAEDHTLVLGHFVEALNEYRALSLESLEHKAVVDDLMAHVERTAVFSKRAANRLDGAVYACAEAARLGENYFFNGSFSREHGCDLG